MNARATQDLNAPARGLRKRAPFKVHAVWDSTYKRLATGFEQLAMQ